MAANIVFWRLKVANLIHRLFSQKILDFLTSTGRRVGRKIPAWPELYSLFSTRVKDPAPFKRVKWRFFLNT